MEISERLNQWRDTFSAEELNAEADRLEKMAMRAFEIYRLPVKNEGGIIYDDPQNRFILTKIAENLIPRAWQWEIEFSFREGLSVILGRFFGAIKDDSGNII